MKKQKSLVSDAAMLNLTTLIREAARVVNDPVEVKVHLWKKELRVAEVTLSRKTENRLLNETYSQTDARHAPLILACERYLWHYDNNNTDIELIESMVYEFFSNDEPDETVAELDRQVKQLKRTSEKLDSVLEALRELHIQVKRA